MSCKFLRFYNSQKNLLGVFKRYRSHDRSTDRCHDNVAPNLGEDCDLQGKVRNFFSKFLINSNILLKFNFIIFDRRKAWSSGHISAGMK